jgi:ABC-type multidrug transport system permease subunit
MKAFLAILKARNLEFLRDRATLGWNLLFPVLLITGFAFVFGSDDKALYKVGVVDAVTSQELVADVAELKYLELVRYPNLEGAMQRLQHHQIDIILGDADYWLNSDSPKSYVVERMILSATDEPLEAKPVTGKAIRYLDWVVPGILGMNMMFSCLFGVGYVIVRYRKNGVLKRFQATPVSAFSFLGAQVVSRLVVVTLLTSVIFTAMDFMFDFVVLGSRWLMLLVAVLGAASMISLSLLMASRTQSEELAGGLLNLITWPMMLLSGVWFSLEGSPEAVHWLAALFPLTHMLEAARSIMLDGATLADVAIPLAILVGITVVALSLAARLFVWRQN